MKRRGWLTMAISLMAASGSVPAQTARESVAVYAAGSLRAAMTEVATRFGGQVPRTMEEVLTLRGVARKTANVVLGNAYGINDGIPVDTHIQRLSGDWFRLSWTFDTKIAGSRLRWPRTIRRDTDLAGAIRFAKKWELPDPNPTSSQSPQPTSHSKNEGS